MDITHSSKLDMTKIMTISYYVSDNCGRGLPLLMTGPPGGAKTHEIEAYAKAIGVPFVHISPSQRGDGYFGAAPCRGELEVQDDDGDSRKVPVLNFPPPAEIVALQQKGFGIILVDELRTAPRNVRPALLGIIQERRFGELKLHPGIRVFACSNSADESSGNGAPLDPPTANRFCHIPVQDPTLQDAANYYASIAQPRTYRSEPSKVIKEKQEASRLIEQKLDQLRPKYLPKASAMVVSFLRNTNGAWSTCKKYAHLGPLRAQPRADDPNSDGGWGSPRSWSKVVELLTTYMSLADLTKNEGPIMGYTFVPDFSECPELLAMIDGLVGPVSSVFSAASVGLNIIDSESWLDGKEMLVKEDSNDRVFATFQAGATFLIGSAEGELNNAKKDQLLRRADVFFGLASEFPMDVVWPACETIISQQSGGTKDLLSKTRAGGRFLSRHASMIAAIKAAT